MVFRYYSTDLKAWINLVATDETGGVFKLELPADYPKIHKKGITTDALVI